MNIFAVHDDSALAAQALCNQHVIKMALETAQLLSTVSAIYGITGPYKPTHVHHPCTIWASETRGNWLWLLDHGIALCREYRKRYGKRHASESVIEWCYMHGASPTRGEATDFVQAMPEQYRGPDAVLAYRAYYRGEKLKFAKWEPRANRPEWVQ